MSSATAPGRASVAVAVAAVAVVFGALPAAAHTVLSGSAPERGATVSEVPDAVVLQFNNLVVFPQIQITGPDGERVEEAPPVEMGDSVEQPLPDDVAPGTYRVTFRVASADGHPIDGEFEFTYAGPVGAAGLVAVPDTADPPPATSEAPAGLVAGPDTADPPPATSEAPAGPELDDAPEGDLAKPVLTVALLALLGFAGAAVLTARRRIAGGGLFDGAGPPDEAA